MSWNLENISIAIILISLLVGCTFRNSSTSDLRVANSLSIDLSEVDVSVGITSVFDDCKVKGYVRAINCTATRIGESYLVTASHCLNFFPNKLQEVYVWKDYKSMIGAFPKRNTKCVKKEGSSFAESIHKIVVKPENTYSEGSYITTSIDVGLIKVSGLTQDIATLAVMDDFILIRSFEIIGFGTKECLSKTHRGLEISDNEHNKTYGLGKASFDVADEKFIEYIPARIESVVRELIEANDTYKNISLDYLLSDSELEYFRKRILWGLNNTDAMCRFRKRA